ncbi:hypothetical protein LKL35_37280 [Streptomyces sp. ET3-23]|uniref:hypothetical protein n=1 Tax=Streptomyces sp. ET3-23 TaxID=2885643 RepID=UPI001D106E7E|nr:hypothetical protein [Streptomyces sp. ET3-23]MCC2280967.1 hypothetical protein [Streptomyces sp. ET3-23]
MTALTSTFAFATDAPPSWPWPVKPDRYDRHPELTGNEREALVSLGTDLRRYPGGHDPQAPQWKTVRRQLRPLDDVRSSLWCPDDGSYRRGVDDTIVLIPALCCTPPDGLGLVGRGLARADRHQRQAVHRERPGMGRGYRAPVSDCICLPAQRLHRVRPTGQLPTAAAGLASVRQA